MRYVPCVFKDYDGIIEALDNAEKALKEGKLDAADVLKMHALLTRESEAVKILGMHPEQRERLEAIVEKLKPLLPAVIEKKQETPVIAEEGKYSGVVFEPNAPRNGIEKALFSFEDSQDRVGNNGYNRHLRPYEAFTLLIDQIEDYLPNELRATAEDMLDRHGEWLDMAWTMAFNQLHVYIGVSGSLYDDSKTWDRNNFEYESKESVSINDSWAEQWVRIDIFPKEFQEMIYGRSAEYLPDVMKSGTFKAHVRLPPYDAKIHCVRRGGFNNKYSIEYCDGFAASRGVRNKK